jgi:hypothetical protein
MLYVFTFTVISDLLVGLDYKVERQMVTPRTKNRKKLVSHYMLKSIVYESTERLQTYQKKFSKVDRRKTNEALFLFST